MTEADALAAGQDERQEEELQVVFLDDEGFGEPPPFITTATAQDLCGPLPLGDTVADVAARVARTKRK